MHHMRPRLQDGRRTWHPQEDPSLRRLWDHLHLSERIQVPQEEKGLPSSRSGHWLTLDDPWSGLFFFPPSSSPINLVSNPWKAFQADVVPFKDRRVDCFQNNRETRTPSDSLKGPRTLKRQKQLMQTLIECLWKTRFLHWSLIVWNMYFIWLAFYFSWLQISFWPDQRRTRWQFLRVRRGETGRSCDVSGKTSPIPPHRPRQSRVIGGDSRIPGILERRACEILERRVRRERRPPDRNIRRLPPWPLWQSLQLSLGLWIPS